MSDSPIVINANLPKDPTVVPTQDLINVLEDVKAAIGRKINTTPRELITLSRRPQNAVLAYNVTSDSERSVFTSGYKSPIHDYGEIARAVDTESYLARSIQKHREYILKEGWQLSGRTPETIDYVRSRLFEIAMATDVSTDEWIREVVTNLVTYSTSFLVLKRSRDFSTGLRIRLHGKELEPIAGIFPMDPVSVTVKQTLSGRAIRWKQQIDSRTRYFNGDDVICITMDRKSGFVFGTPYSLTVLDDIRALRRLEELVEMVAHKHIFPLFHLKVGTEQRPAGDIETSDGNLISEVELAKMQIADMPMEGGLVTSERMEVQIIGSEGQVLDLQPYIEHFKERVMSGLRLSGLDLGQADTGNKACYTQDTEVLTEDGWILHQHWKGQRIAVFDPKTRSIFLDTPKKLHSYNVDEEIIRFKSKGQDIAVTEDHTILYRIPHNSHDNFKVDKAKDIEDKKTIEVISGADKWMSSNNTIYSPDYLKFLGIAISEGGLSSTGLKKGKYHMTLAQSHKKEHNVIEIRRILKSIGAKFGEYEDKKLNCVRWNVYGKSLLAPLFEAIGRYSNSKRIPREYLDLPQDYLRHLFEGLMLGDGSWDTRLGRKSGYYSSTSIQLANDVQELAFKLGYGTKLSLHYDAFDNKNPCYRVSIRTRNRRKISNIYREHYKGMVYCFETLQGFYVTRRNGCIAVQGNTAQVVNRNLVDAVKDFQKAISDQLTSRLLDYLVLEGGFDLNLDTRVLFTFPTADREEQRSQQQHGISLFQSNAITCEEMRREFLKKEPLTPEEENDTFFNRFEMPVLKMQMEAKKAASAGSGTKKDKIKRSNEVRARPRNQFKLSPSKPAIPVNDKINYYNTLKISISDKKLLLSLFKEDLENTIKLIINDGIKQGTNVCNSVFLCKYNATRTSIDSYINKNINPLLNNVIQNSIIMLNISNFDFNSLSTTLDELFDKVLLRSMNFGFVEALKNNPDIMDDSYTEIDIDLDCTNLIEKIVDNYND